MKNPYRHNVVLGVFKLKLKTLNTPSLEEAAAFIKSALLEKATIIIIGECRVDYEGRGASRLELGERFVIIKQDGSVLVHRPTGFSPVNWQPPASVIEVAFRREIGLLVHAVRESPREYLTVVFTRVDLVVSAKLVDAGEFIMYVDEPTMRDVIAETPSLVEEGLRVLAVEKPVGSGKVDLYGVDKNGRPVLVELKRTTATREAAIQLKHYVEAFKREHGQQPRGILVAPAFSPSAIETLLRLGLEYRHVDLKKVWLLVKQKQRKRIPSLEDFSKK
jgi:RecB family endonuclease NucS